MPTGKRGPSGGRWSAALVLTLALASCSTGAVDPHSANTLEILYGKGVKTYLAQRREELRQITARATALDDELFTRLGDLHAMETKLKSVSAKARGSDAAVAAIEKEIASQKAKAEALFGKVVALKEDVAVLEAGEQAAQSDTAQDKAKIAGLKEQITVLESEIVVINRAIERSLKVKAEQLFLVYGAE